MIRTKAAVTYTAELGEQFCMIGPYTEKLYIWRWRSVGTNEITQYKGVLVVKLVTDSHSSQTA